MHKCLIIDDSSIVRKVAKRVLADQDLEIMESESAAEALEKIRLDMPDFIVVEKEIAGMPVDEFIRRVETMAGGREHMPKIMVGMISMDLPGFLRAKRAGAKGYFMKPFTRATLSTRFEAIRAG